MLVWNKRVELIQDFDFPEASLRIKQTRDQKFIIATGVYKPQMRVFELSEMAMKFDRHTSCENVQFEILSDDWTKTVFLQSDRTVEFHTPSGMHFSTRIPKFGRDLAYNYSNCDLLLGAASSEVYRLNLEQGQFMKGFDTELPAVNVTKINPVHQMYSFGGENGVVEFWDPRSRKAIAMLDVSSRVMSDLIPTNKPVEISAIKHLSDGLNIAIGTINGHVLLYDFRKNTPYLTKDHQYGFPIKSIHMHAASGNIITADTKIVKIWNKQDGKLMTSVEPPTDINDMEVQQDTGYFMLANEGLQIQSYYIPELGPAPKWCAFLDNLTEELEESDQPQVYDNYKFVSKEELIVLGLDHLIGTNVLRAYMHGYFIDFRLYEKAKAIANPFAFEDYKKKLIQEKISKQQESRIKLPKKLPKVNKQLALKLADDEEFKVDDRFADVFKDDQFAVDENSAEYKALHPVLRQKAVEEKEELQLMESFEPDSESENEGPKLYAAQKEVTLTMEEKARMQSVPEPVESVGGRETKFNVKAGKRYPSKFKAKKSAEKDEQEMSIEFARERKNHKRKNMPRKSRKR